LCSTPALAAEAEAHRRAFHLHVPAAQRREAEGLVLARVLLIADADERLVEQADDGGEHLVARELLALQVALDAIAQQRQHLAELEHVAELGAIARPRDTDV
jgi:hypothetical protein